jgi:hypothetical protein
MSTDHIYMGVGLVAFLGLWLLLFFKGGSGG